MGVVSDESAMGGEGMRRVGNGGQPCALEGAGIPNVQGPLGRFNPEQSPISISPKLRIRDAPVTLPSQKRLRVSVNRSMGPSFVYSGDPPGSQRRFTGLHSVGNDGPKPSTRSLPPRGCPPLKLNLAYDLWQHVSPVGPAGSLTCRDSPFSPTRPALRHD